MKRQSICFGQLDFDVLGENCSSCLLNYCTFVLNLWDYIIEKLDGSRGNDYVNMEVDQFAMDLYAGENSRLPLIDETSAFGSQAPKDR